jgi:hypothetical protein
MNKHNNSFFEVEKESHKPFQVGIKTNYITHLSEIKLRLN